MVDYQRVKPSFIRFISPVNSLIDKKRDGVDIGPLDLRHLWIAVLLTWRKQKTSQWFSSLTPVTTRVSRVSTVITDFDAQNLQ